jgi:hypothetical protein
MLAKKNWPKILALAFVVLYLLYKSCLGGEVASLDTDLIHNRPWVERIALNPREHVHGMIFREEGKGASFFGSRYQLEVSLFDWKVSGEKLSVHYLQKDERVEYRARVWACEAPRPFDLCLEMTNGGKATKLYSRTGWKIGSSDELPRYISGEAN